MLITNIKQKSSIEWEPDRGNLLQMGKETQDKVQGMTPSNNKRMKRKRI
jgi:hypothetical protein